jgi:hypothetical protein
MLRCVYRRPHFWPNVLSYGGVQLNMNHALTFSGRPPDFEDAPPGRSTSQVEHKAQRLVNGPHLVWADHSLAR